MQKETLGKIFGGVAGVAFGLSLIGGLALMSYVTGGNPLNVMALMAIGSSLAGVAWRLENDMPFHKGFGYGLITAGISSLCL